MKLRIKSNSSNHKPPVKSSVQLKEKPSPRLQLSKTQRANSFLLDPTSYT